MAAPAPEHDRPATATDVSPVLGGPLFRLWRRTRLAGPELELGNRRILALTLIAWVPLALLSLIEGTFSGGVARPFLQDIETQVRFLVSLPILIGVEVLVHRRLRLIVVQFVDDGLIADENLPAFRRALDAARRLRDSVWIELALLVFVYTVGLWVWRSQAAVAEATWSGSRVSGELRLTLAGRWQELISVPIFQFILLRWAVRGLIWFALLWRIARVPLRLQPAHPDRAAGLGFLGESSRAFAPLLFAQGALLAALLAGKYYFEGQSILSFKMLIATFVVVYVLAVLAPLLVFSPRLAYAKRRGLVEYGALGSRLQLEFQRRWLPPEGKSEGLLDSGDVSVICDFAAEYAAVREMRPVAFGVSDVARLVAATAAPVLPLLLTVMPLGDLLKRIVKIVL